MSGNGDADPLVRRPPARTQFENLNKGRAQQIISDMLDYNIVSCHRKTVLLPDVVSPGELSLTLRPSPQAESL